MELSKIGTFLLGLNLLLVTIDSNDPASYEVKVEPNWSSRSTAKVKDFVVDVKSLNEAAYFGEPMSGVRVDFEGGTHVSNLNATIVKSNSSHVQIRVTAPDLQVSDDVHGKLEIHLHGPTTNNQMLRLETPFLYRAKPSAFSVVMPNFTVAAGGMHVLIHGKNFDIADRLIYLRAKQFSPTCMELCSVVSADTLLCATPNLLNPSCNLSYNGTSSSDFARHSLVGKWLDIDLSDNVDHPPFSPLLIVKDPILHDSTVVKSGDASRIEIKGEFPASDHSVEEDVTFEIDDVECTNVRRIDERTYGCDVIGTSAVSEEQSFIFYYGNLMFEHKNPSQLYMPHPVIIITSSILAFVFLTGLLSGVATCCRNARSHRHDRKVAVVDSNVVDGGAALLARDSDVTLEQSDSEDRSGKEEKV